MTNAGFFKDLRKQEVNEDHRGRYAEGNAHDSLETEVRVLQKPFQRDSPMSEEAREVVSPQRIGQKGRRNDNHRPARHPAGRFQHEQHGHSCHHKVHRGVDPGPGQKVLVEDDVVQSRCKTEKSKKHVIPGRRCPLHPLSTHGIEEKHEAKPYAQMDRPLQLRSKRNCGGGEDVEHGKDHAGREDQHRPSTPQSSICRFSIQPREHFLVRFQDLLVLCRHCHTSARTISTSGIRSTVTLVSRSGPMPATRSHSRRPTDMR